MNDRRTGEEELDQSIHGWLGFRMYPEQSLQVDNREYLSDGSQRHVNTLRSELPDKIKDAYGFTSDKGFAGLD